MLLESERPTVDEFARATGWRVTTDGACRAEVCVPLPPEALTVDGDEERVDVAVVAERLGMGVANDEESGLTAVGPASTGGRALATVQAPDLELPDFDGNLFRLGSLRGTKVVLVAWAPY